MLEPFDTVKANALASDFYDQYRESALWLENFNTQFETAWKHYECIPTPEKGPDGKDNLELTQVGVPLTNAAVRRTVARVTAQIPDLRFASKDRDVAEFIGRSLMYQWDRAKIQDWQQKHVLQAAIFGWSVRPWYWTVEEGRRRRRYNLRDPKTLTNPIALKEIGGMYGIPLDTLPPDQVVLVLARLDAEKSNQGWIKVDYSYRGYEGPQCDFLFIGDCFPQPGFESLRRSERMILRRKRSFEWLQKLAKLHPDLAPGIANLIDKQPAGQQGLTKQTDTTQLRERMLAVLGQTDQTQLTSTVKGAPFWNIYERHTQGADSRLAFMGEDQTWIGEIPYPYDIPDGRFALTDCTLIDNLLHGIGDSNARFMLGIHKILERQVGRQADLIDMILQPLMGTKDRQLYENPGLLKRFGGGRLVYLRGQDDLWVHPEQAAIASAASTAANSEGNIYRLAAQFGDSNGSMGAEVDPSQNRTATGAKITQSNMDILTKALVQRFTASSVSEDALMMLALNRSEATEPVEFDASLYERRIFEKEEDQWKQKWVSVSPSIFQEDGQVVAEAGSMLADDDEAKVQIASTLYSVAKADPAHFNVSWAAKGLLIAHGKRNELSQWAPTPPPPPPPPEMKESTTLSIKWLELDEDGRVAFAQKLGIPYHPAPAPGAPPQPNAHPPASDGPAPPIQPIVANAGGSQNGL